MAFYAGIVTGICVVLVGVCVYAIPRRKVGAENNARVHQELLDRVPTIEQYTDMMLKIAGGQVVKVSSEPEPEENDHFIPDIEMDTWLNSDQIPTIPGWGGPTQALTDHPDDLTP